MSVILSKNDFCRAINALKRNDDLLDKLNNLFSENNSNNVIYSTGLENTLVDLLEIIFDDKNNQWIAYYIWETDYGDKYQEGDVTESDGTIIPLKTPEDLYDLLVRNMGQAKE